MSYLPYPCHDYYFSPPKKTGSAKQFGGLFIIMRKGTKGFIILAI